MRLISTAHLRHNDILGKSIMNGRNQILLNEGVVLTERLINRLIDLGIPYVYVREAKTEHIIPESSCSDELRYESIGAIEDTFAQVGNSSTISEGSFVMEKASKKFMKLIRSILGELRDKKDLLNLLADVYAYDQYIFTHSFNVTLYTLAIGMEMGLAHKQLEQLGMGAILHDVGKMQVKKDILLKPGKLTEEEYEQIKMHSEHGYRMLKEVPNLPLLVAHCAYQHHERINGSGYPRGLKGQDIHLYGKIIAVADVFDAVTTNRVYRKAMLPHEALEILYAGAGTLFEQNIVEAFRNSVAVYPVGLTVILNDRRIGVVVRQNMGTSNRPVVYIIEENGVPVEEPYELNLMKTLDIVITDCDTTMYEPGGIHARQMNE